MKHENNGKQKLSNFFSNFKNWFLDNLKVFQGLVMISVGAFLVYSTAYIFFSAMFFFIGTTLCLYGLAYLDFMNLDSLIVKIKTCFKK